MQVIEKVHQSLGHVGINKTVNFMKSRYFWPRMEDDIEIYLSKCETCCYTKLKNPIDRAPLQSTLTGEPFERIALDITGPFRTTINGNRFILGIIDHFSKYASLIPLKNSEAKSVAKALLKEWISTFGAPIEIITDNERSFKNELMNHLWLRFGFQTV